MVQMSHIFCCKFAVKSNCGEEFSSTQEYIPYLYTCIHFVHSTRETSCEPRSVSQKSNDTLHLKQNQNKSKFFKPKIRWLLFCVLWAVVSIGKFVYWGSATSIARLLGLRNYICIYLYICTINASDGNKRPTIYDIYIAFVFVIEKKSIRFKIMVHRKIYYRFSHFTFIELQKTSAII